MRRRNRDGFSLVELLVVIAILGILAALLLPTFATAKARAQRIQCGSNVRQLGMAMQLFVSDNGVYPLGVNGIRFDAGIYPEHMHDWRGVLEKEIPRVGNTDVNNVWHCPAFHPPPVPEKWSYGWNSYGYNSFGLGVELEDHFGLGGHKGARSQQQEETPVHEAEVVKPSEMMMIGDGFYGGMYPEMYVKDGSRFLGRQRVVAEVGTHPPYDDKFGSTQRAEHRHQGKANVVFCDGHVESPKLKYLFEDTSDAALVRWNRDHLPHRERLQ